MSNSDNLSFHGTLPLAVFAQLSLQLHQMAQVVKDAVVFTDQVFGSMPLGAKPQEKFTVIVSHSFSVLLLGSLLEQKDEAVEPFQSQSIENLTFHSRELPINLDFDEFDL